MVILHNILDIIDNLPEQESFSLPSYKQNSLKIEFSDKHDCVEPVYGGQKPPLPFADSAVFNASIAEARRLTALEGDCKAVYDVIFNVEDSSFNWKAGDTIGVIPHNDDSDVNLIISHLEIANADLCYTLSVDGSVKGSKVPAHVPVKSTLRYVLTHCLDLRSLLKKLFLLALSKYTTDAKERKILEYLCSKEGSTAYTTYILNKGLCILDIFTIFMSCKPPVEVLLANLPRLLPRPYSIVNSGLKSNKSLKICFSVMTVNNRKGLTTGWLENMVLNDLSLENQIQNLTLNEASNSCKVPIYLRKNMNLFLLPEEVKLPLILMGPGTGVAPFIGFLEEREYLKENNPEIELGECWLFFGCRNLELDFIYEEELNGFKSRGILNKLSTAFSRIKDSENKYIQDVLKQNINEIIKLINSGAIVYICGDLKTMAVEVKEVLIKGFMEQNNMTTEESNAKMCEMQKDKKIIVDAWS